MKKLLILGGASVHCKLVSTAKELGCYTIVTDYLEDSPAKKIADESWMINIMDVNSLVEKCRENKIDGVIAGWLDPCQRPYAEICHKLGLHCYGTPEQFFKMTNKHAFKKMCMENGVDVIPEYTETDVQNGTVEFPVFVKPVDSRGSRGQSVCYSREELLSAIKFAKSESSNGDVIIEKYMKDAHEFQVTYFYVDDKPYLVRTVDSYCGAEENHLEKVVACAISPSRYTELYLSQAHENVIKMFSNLGIKNGPIFMQGFEDNGVFRFFDPGLRFPGVDYEKIYEKVFGTNLMAAMIDIALTGACSNLALPENGVFIDGKRAAILFPTVRAGKVGKISGVDDLKQDDAVVSFWPRCKVGDTIEWAYNVNQRAAEIDIVTSDTESLKKKVGQIQERFKVINDFNEDMTYEKFDVSRIV